MSEEKKKTGSGIDGYKLVKKLGKGGMATVYLAVQEGLARKVAIKVMHPNPSDPTYGDRFIREAKIVATLSHPNIVPIYDVGLSGGKHHFMAMEYLAGGDLSSRIAADSLSHDEIIRITSDIASALDAAHKKQYIHRDVKPDNIMFKEDGTAVLTDFGIAKPQLPDSNMTQVGKVIGTPKYMSPEQTKGDEIDKQTDLYALGIVLYEMLTGRVPFNGKDAFDIGIKHLKDPVPALPENAQQFQSIVTRLLAKNKDKRMQTGQEVIDALHQIQFGEAPQMMTSEAETITGFNADATIPNPEAHKQSGMTADKADRSGEHQADATTEKKSSKLPAILIVLLLLLGGGFAAVWFAPQIMPQEGPLMQAHNQLMTWLYPEKAQLKAALDNAELAMSEERYLEPENNNALGFYREALSIDSENETALQGIEKLIGIYLKKALTKIDENQFDDAEALLMQAKTIKGDTPEIIAALDALDAKKANLAFAAEEAAAAEAKRAADVKAAKLAKQRAEEAAARKAAAASAKAAAAAEAARKEAQRQRLAELAEQERLRQEEENRKAEEAAKAKARMLNLRVKGLLAKADTYLARGEYRLPVGENALEKYLAAKSLDASNTEAQIGIEKVVTILIPEIDELLKSQQVGMAKDLFDQLIGAAPDHPDLIEIGQSKGW